VVHSRRERRYGAIRLAGSLAVLAVMLFPVYWMVISGLKGTEGTLFHEPPYLYPPNADWRELLNVVRTYGKGLVNSVVISSIAVAITAVVCVPGAYALAKLGVGRRINYAILLALLVVQALPTIMLVAPLFETAAHLQLVNHYFTIGVLDSMYAVPFAVLILRAYMLKLPEELREAALIDGATEVQIFSRVMLPNSKPGVGTILLFAFLFAWGDFIFGLTFTNGTSVAPVTVSLYELIGTYAVSWQTLMALSTVLAVPAVIVVLVFQRFLQQGVTGFGMEK